MAADARHPRLAMDEGAHDPGAGRGDSLVSAPGRSPALDAGQLEVLRRYGTERDVAAGTVSTTVRVRRTSWNATKPRIQCVLTQ
jgi:hypothetical protein